MKPSSKLLIACLALLTASLSPLYGTSGSLSVKNLKAEYRINPTGLETPSPRLSWELVSNQQDCRQLAYQIRSSSDKNGLADARRVLWNSGMVESQKSVHVLYEGPSPKSGDRVWWQVRVRDNQGNESEWSEAAFFEMGLLKPDDWRALWIEEINAAASDTALPAPMFRKEFRVRDRVASARLYITAHGLYHAELDGQVVTSDLFNPGWTSYRKRLQYQVYDLTDRLTPGTHALGVMLGEGWYLGSFGWTNNRNFFGDKMGLLAQLVIEYENGRREYVVTDPSWKASFGPVIKSDIYNGELYDARLEKQGWSQAGFDDRLWKPVKTASYPKEILVSQEGPPVRRIEELVPVQIFTAPNGDTLVDMGQNMVGRIRLRVSGEAGTRVTLRHAEVLDQQGNLYTANLRTAKQQVEYILKGSETEVYEPLFTFQGFRYVSVSGYPGKLTPESLTGIVIHSDMEPAGSFECSEPMLNQLQRNIVWGLKGNFLDVPTDCPQRDERMGWTGDAQVFAPTACFNMDAATFYTKWLRDVSADQHENGAVPHVIPDVIGGGAATGWADAAVIVPWILYQTYGDTRILEEQYESMKAWVQYMQKQAGERHLWTTGNHFGDWLAFASTRSDYTGATTDKDFLATAYFAHSAGLLSKTAKVLGKEEDAREFSELRERVKQAFQQEFMTPNGRLSPNTQTAYVVALTFGLLPESLESAAAKRLADDVNHFGHITTGFLGAADINPTLSAYGYWDEAYKLLLRTAYPSWLYPITKGATTIWERWDGIKPDGSFQDVGMNSFNHYAYGAVGNWMYRNIAGIQHDPEHPGYSHFFIRPRPGGGVDWARATHKTMYGEIRSSWILENSTLKMEVTVPANTSATIFIPKEGSFEIRKVGSGSYTFIGTM